MATPAKLVVKVDVDSTQASAELDRAAGKINAFSKIASAALAFKVAGEVVDGIKAVTNAASDLSETITAGGVVFGEGFAQVDAFAKNAARSLGQSRRQAIEAATTFATFGKAAGLSGDKLADFSTDLTGLASDLASFKNTSPEEAITAIGAALRGEMEPIRRYGVILDDATLRQVALKNGIIATTKNALTPAQKVLASNLAIWEQTTDAQGDFARTSEGLANQQRILNGLWEDMQAELGVALMPIFLQVGRILLDTVVPAIQGVITELVRFFKVLTGQEDAVDTGTWADPFVRGAQTVRETVVKVIEKIVEFKDTVVRLWEESETFRTKVGDAFGTVQEKLQPIADGIKTVFDRLKEIEVPTALETIGNIFDEVEKLPEKLKPSVDAVKTELKKLEGPLRDLKEALDPFVKPIKDLADEHFPKIAFAVGLVTAPLLTLVTTFLILWHNSEDFRNSVKSLARFLLDELPGVIETVGSFLRDLVNAFKELAIALQPVLDVFADQWPEVKKDFEELMVAVQPFVDLLRDNLVPILIVAGALFASVTGPVLVLGAAFLYLWTQSEIFRNVFNTLVSVLVQGIVLSLSLAIRGLMNALTLLFSYWTFVWETMAGIVSWVSDQIHAVIDNLFDPLFGTLQTAVDEVTRAFNNILDFVRNTARDIGDALRNIWEPLVSGFRDAWNRVVGLWNGIQIPTIRLFIGTPFEQNLGGGFLPSLPRLADGGIVRRPTVALIGEAGPEAVVPLGKMGNTTINVSVAHSGLAVDSPRLQRDIVDALRRWERREGPLWGIS